MDILGEALQRIYKESADSLVPFPSVVKERHMEEELIEKGMKAIRDGEVAVLILAAGQGSRLGYEKPKALFPICNKCLLEILIDRVDLVSTTVPIYVMIGRGSESHFHPFRDRIITFEQPELPCFDNEGNIIMLTPHKAAMAPNGNGAVFSCMPPLPPTIKIVSQCAIDNVMAKPLDPYVIGFHMYKKCDCVITTVLKRDPQESVGVVCLDSNDRVRVAEYSETGHRPGFEESHICINTFSAHLFRKDTVLPYHVVKDKRIPTWKDPEKRGNKLEMYIFDIFPLVSHVEVIRVDRETNFVPLKSREDIGKSTEAFVRDCASRHG